MISMASVITLWEKARDDAIEKGATRNKVWEITPMFFVKSVL